MSGPRVVALTHNARALQPEEHIYTSRYFSSQSVHFGDVNVSYSYLYVLSILPEIKIIVWNICMYWSTMLVKRNATLNHEIFVSSLDEVVQLWRWLKMLIYVQSWPPSFRGGHQKFLIWSCVSFDQHRRCAQLAPAGTVKIKTLKHLAASQFQLNVCFLPKHNLGDCIVHLDGFIYNCSFI